MSMLPAIFQMKLDLLIFLLFNRKCFNLFMLLPLSYNINNIVPCHNEPCNYNAKMIKWNLRV